MAKSSKKKGTNRGARLRSAALSGAALVLLLVVSAVLGISPQEVLDLLQGTPQATARPTPVTVTGEWWRIYFTEPVRSSDPALFVDGIDQYLVQAIDQARETLDIAAFEFNLSSVTEAVLAAHARGVEVRVVTDGEYGFHDEDSTLTQLTAAGIPVVEDGRTDLMHNKFMVIDGAQVWTGSWNYTINGTYRNNNNAIAIDAPALAAIYTREFEEMFEANEFGPTSTSTAAEQHVVINQTPIQVYFAPEDDVGDRLVELVEAAEKRVRFMAFSFTHDAIGQALLARARSGVTVEGIFEKRGSTTQYSELIPLFCGALPVRWDGNPRVLHHKVLIIDDETVVLGSFNFSASADEDNDENVLIVQNADIAAEYNAEFDRRWREGTTPQSIACSQ